MSIDTVIDDLECELRSVNAYGVIETSGEVLEEAIALLRTMQWRSVEDEPSYGEQINIVDEFPNGNRLVSGSTYTGKFSDDTILWKPFPGKPE